jgi:hypothetical protein
MNDVSSLQVDVPQHETRPSGLRKPQGDHGGRPALSLLQRIAQSILFVSASQ